MALCKPQKLTTDERIELAQLLDIQTSNLTEDCEKCGACSKTDIKLSTNVFTDDDGHKQVYGHDGTPRRGWRKPRPVPVDDRRVS